MTAIQDVADDAPPFECRLKGMPCLVQSSEGGSWARGEVKQIKTDGDLVVRLVDFGDRDQVISDMKLLRDIPDEFLKLPAQSILCSIAGMSPKGDKWSQKAKDDFRWIVDDLCAEVFLHFKAHSLVTPLTSHSSAFPVIHHVIMGDAEGNDNFSRRFFAYGHAIADYG